MHFKNLVSHRQTDTHKDSSLAYCLITWLTYPKRFKAKSKVTSAPAVLAALTAPAAIATTVTLGAIAAPTTIAALEIAALSAPAAF